MSKLPNIHPGEILREEFLRELGITSYRLAKETKMPPTRISQIVREKRRITPDTALRLSKFFSNSAEFWLNLQMEFDLREGRSQIKNELDSINHFQAI
ncbi:MAG: addiction module antidote protein, HigA family [Calditrichaeota bacterium]|nr:MAG: addiction module antidote protein, HigA family [Calditrichota bacterium]MBL1205938.1 addiction module antidote protein, HigA family [Calditrichota bacterium]NOG45766.1 HigA family addiction module antidote protein [Calditrichota bacterium]